MSGERITFDTNILVYAADSDAGERHRLAIKVLERAIQYDCVLTLQALSEFFSVVTQKNKLSLKLAAERVHEFAEIFPVINAKQKTLKLATDAIVQQKLPFWDAWQSH